MKRKDFVRYDKEGKQIKCGYMEIVNKSNDEEDLYFYGDIMSGNLSEDYKKYCPDDKCPADIQAFLDEIEDGKTLNIHINSGGGSVFGGIAIYNLLKNKKCTKNVYIDGIAASIASAIACCADRIIIPANATFMIHKPTNGYFWTTMNADELRKDAEALDNCQKAITSIYMQHVKEGVTEEKITELINNETWMTGEEACKYFNFELSDSNNAAACCSDFYEKYKNTPESLKDNVDKKDTLDLDKLARKIADEMENRQKAREKEYRSQILNSLANYGK